MAFFFNEFIECAIGNIHSHFAADVTVRFRKPPFIDTTTEDVDVISVNGFEDPWKYHQRVALDCEYFIFNFIELRDSHEESEIPALYEQLYLYLPPIADCFYYKEFPFTGETSLSFNMQGMFRAVNWHDETTGAVSEPSHHGDDIIFQVSRGNSH